MKSDLTDRGAGSVRRLLVGYKAQDLDASLVAGDVVCHALDIYHKNAIESAWHVKAVCTPHLPEGPWDEIRFKTGPKLMSGELALDLMQEIARLSPDARLWGGSAATPKVFVDFVGRERDRNDLIDKIRDNPGRVRDFSAKWLASVPGGPKVEFVSYPGCFCHRRHDEGGLALAEVASRDLSASTSPVKILDMGCGCGLVGCLIASVVENVSLTMVDSHSRAIEAATLNAKNLGLDSQILLSADGTPPEMDGTFDVFVGNPPYYSDYRIADVFLETAARALKKGGVCYTVVKNDAGLKPVQERWFPSVEVIHRRGYCVLKSHKSDSFGIIRKL